MDMLTSPDVDAVEQAVLEVWTFESGFPTIRDDADVSCGYCGGRLLIRWWRYFAKEDRHKNITTPYRCDVSTKCCRCSALGTFGVVVPRDVWENLDPRVPGVTFKRERARQAGLIKETDDA